MTTKMINLICTMSLAAALIAGYATGRIENFLLGGFIGAMLALPLSLIHSKSQKRKKP